MTGAVEDHLLRSVNNNRSARCILVSTQTHNEVGKVGKNLPTALARSKEVGSDLAGALLLAQK